MKEWGIIIAAALAFFYIIYAIEKVGSLLGTRVDELNAKVDAIQEKLDQVESNLEMEVVDKNYVNPID